MSWACLTLTVSVYRRMKRTISIGDRPFSMMGSVPNWSERNRPAIDRYLSIVACLRPRSWARYSEKPFSIRLRLLSSSTRTRSGTTPVSRKCLSNFNKVGGSILNIEPLRPLHKRYSLSVVSSRSLLLSPCWSNQWLRSDTILILCFAVLVL